MLRFLFPGLTASPKRGERAFAAATAVARQSHWYSEGGVTDTLDGRFRMIATVVALVLVRLESAGDAGHAASVALTERFAEVMESEHRQLGFGDPKLGRTVRRLVSALARRVDIWRDAIAAGSEWTDAARSSVRGDEGGPAAPGLSHTAEALRAFWCRIERLDARAIEEGELS